MANPNPKAEAVKGKVIRAIIDILEKYGEDGATSAQILIDAEAAGTPLKRDSVNNALHRGTQRAILRVVGDPQKHIGKKWRVMPNALDILNKRNKPQPVIGAEQWRRYLDDEDTDRHGVVKGRKRADVGPPCIVRRVQSNGVVVDVRCSSHSIAAIEIKLNGGQIVDATG